MYSLMQTFQKTIAKLNYLCIEKWKSAPKSEQRDGSISQARALLFTTYKVWLQLFTYAIEGKSLAEKFLKA